MSTGPVALSLEHIHKRFGNVRALNDASLHVRKGTVHAVLGENGAGKTTLMRVAYGMEHPDSGSVQVRGAPVRFRSPSDAIAYGLGMVHQHFTLVPAMTVAENLALGTQGVFNSEETVARLRDLTRTTGLSIDPSARVRDLSVTEQQRLELLKLLSRNAEILILDEPTAVLAPTEADDLLRQLRQLADAGHAVVLITHKLREALHVADDVTVLRHGGTTLAKTRSDLDEDELVDAMLGQRGREDRAPTTRRSRDPGEVVIAARDLSIVDARGSVRIRNATFDVRGGEIVGVAAVDGSGHRELLRAIAGRLPVKAGTLTLPASVGFVPDDRQRDALVLDMSLTDNFVLKGAGSRRGLIRWRTVAREARAVMDEFDVRAETEESAVRTLSGGNQQRFILGRELHGSPAVVVAENPTRGLDVGASAYLYRRLIEACSDGVAIVVHSTDIDELLRIVDRVLVVYSGSVREVPLDRETVGRAMLGAA